MYPSKEYYKFLKLLTYDGNLTNLFIKMLEQKIEMETVNFHELASLAITSDNERYHAAIAKGRVEMLKELYSILPEKAIIRYRI